ncbi:putative mobile element transfer protein [Streptomyces scabiei 87.22]|uniref:Putative mobile element transfer protein n=3 Tax=Streptomyces scabiei TaxID=1930 RepID=C9ZC54_STRSW|nr:DUF2637 domain-containing protein [Streptomyces scabiei]MDX2574890.1 DUF2637 domain-containing protein [Streptomyces scabiei]MDX2650810.1 DUF2637 domain-containing protein [Streptomyces scabiei]MDX2719848.1 DUF2637 domain-containing protein [Streptomyces scabiei]MDX2868844.1 DUF2637 domain-containing protein [Streptomyces scabiei]MDX2886018.1 DUF2637 domain-containing protein [Streptomyces scabiei]
MRAQLARVDAVLVQALIAAALSFAHLHDIASAAGQDGWKAWAYPVSVDLLLVAAWRRLRSGEAKAAGWCWFVIALAASLGANVATAGLLDLNNVPAWLRILVAGWPAVAFLGGTLLAHTTPATTDQDHKGPEDTDDTVDQEHAPELAPEEPPPTPSAIEPSPPERPAVPVPAALVEHARKVAAEHHNRTGAPIDTPTLRARLGVPAPMAEAIAAHLT